MSKKLHIIITTLILASFVLQILTLVGNFNSLQSVYIARFDIHPATNGGGGLFDSLISKATDAMPKYFTVALFIACEGKSTNETICSPATFGYKFNGTNTGVLQTVENQIPDSVHSALTGVQVAFILSAISCFILFCYYFFHHRSGSGQGKNKGYGLRRIVTILFVSGIATVFGLATFIIQMVIYGMLKKGVDVVKDDLSGGMINKVVTINTTLGPSIWMSLGASVSLIFATVLVGINIYRSKSKKTTGTEMTLV